MKAIYELKGDDLKIGFGVDGLLRPTRFEMGPDQVGWLLVLKREREDAQAAPVKEQEDKKPLPKGPDAEAQSVAPAAHVKKPLAIVRVPGSGTLGVALSPDGKILARAGTGQTTGQTVDLWDVASGKQLHTLKGHTETILKVAFSPDGKTLASSTEIFGADGTKQEMKLWDVATGKERAPVGGHRKNISFGAFSPDGKTLATSHRYGTAGYGPGRKLVGLWLGPGGGPRLAHHGAFVWFLGHLTTRDQHRHYHFDLPDGLPHPAGQNKDSLAIQLKLNEIVAAIDAASNHLINVEDLGEEDVAVLHQHYQKLAELVKHDHKVTQSHSIEEAERRYERHPQKRLHQNK